MYRNSTLQQIKLADENKIVTLAGWVSKIRKMGV